MNYKDATSMKETSIKNLLYYFFNGMVNIKNFDPSLLETKKLSCKSANVNIYHIDYMTMESLDLVSINSENPLCLIFDNVNG